MSTRLPSVIEPSGYLLEVLREGADFTLYRGRQRGNSPLVLAVGLAAERPSPQGLKRLEHEYSPRHKLPNIVSAWDYRW